MPGDFVETELAKLRRLGVFMALRHRSGKIPDHSFTRIHPITSGFRGSMAAMPQVRWCIKGPPSKGHLRVPVPSTLTVCPIQLHKALDLESVPSGHNRLLIFQRLHFHFFIHPYPPLDPRRRCAPHLRPSATGFYGSSPRWRKECWHLGSH